MQIKMFILIKKYIIKADPVLLIINNKFNNIQL